ncbi:MAG: hypothetical protein ACXWE9_10285 [Methylobacter sp.]
MFLPLLLTALVAYIIFVGLFVAATSDTNRQAKWLGLAALTASAPVFIWFGAFGEQFESGQCYTQVITMIAHAIEKTDAPTTLAEKVRALPLHGYETNCSEVEAAVHELPNAAAP